MKKHKRLLAVGAAGVVLLLNICVGSVGAQDVTQGYLTDATLQKGMIVRLKKDDTAKVEALTQEANKDMMGVVASAEDTPVSLTNPENKQEVLVGTFGRYEVLVSTQNGVIAPGDYITISSLSGVGMKADNRQETVIGKALDGFKGGNEAVSTTQLKDSAGKETQVALKRIMVDVQVAPNPLFLPARTDGVPSFLARAVRVVTDEPIGAVRIYASLVVLIVATFVAGSVVFSGVRTGMVSVGRNPLAKKSITKGLVQVTLVSLIIFIIGMIAVYLLLRL